MNHKKNAGRLPVFAIILLVLAIVFIGIHRGIGNHRYFAYALLQEPTCTSEGIIEYRCVICWNKCTKPMRKMSHSYTAGHIRPASCIEEGEDITLTCKVCGEIYTIPMPKRLPHMYRESIQTEATCTEPGVRLFVCKICGDSYSMTISPFGHAWAEETDQTPKTCTRCGKTEGSALTNDHSESGGKNNE